MPGDPQAFVSVEVCYLMAFDEVGLGFLQVLVGVLLVAFLVCSWAWEHLDASQVAGWAYMNVHLAGLDEVASASWCS